MTNDYNNAKDKIEDAFTYLEEAKIAEMKNAGLPKTRLSECKKNVEENCQKKCNYVLKVFDDEYSDCKAALSLINS